MNRREFMSWVGVGAIASSLPVALAACAPKTGSAGLTDPLTVGTLADLDQQGQLMSESPAGKVLVVRDPANAEQLVAVNPVCTHKGCDVEWKTDQTAFVCPCHGAKFGPDGAVLQGPADKPLAVYAVKVEGDAVVVGG